METFLRCYICIFIPFTPPNTMFRYEWYTTPEEQCCSRIVLCSFPYFYSKFEPCPKCKPSQLLNFTCIATPHAHTRPQPHRLPPLPGPPQAHTLTLPSAYPHCLPTPPEPHHPQTPNPRTPRPAPPPPTLTLPPPTCNPATPSPPTSPRSVPFDETTYPESSDGSEGPPEGPPSPASPRPQRAPLLRHHPPQRSTTASLLLPALSPKKTKFAPLASASGPLPRLTSPASPSHSSSGSAPLPLVGPLSSTGDASPTWSQVSTPDRLVEVERSGKSRMGACACDPKPLCMCDPKPLCACDPKPLCVCDPNPLCA